MIEERIYKELEGIVGPENLTQEPAICDSYAAQPFHRTEPGIWINRPAAVILPGNTDEVSLIVKICNKYKLKYKAHSTGFGAQSGPSEDGVLQVDLRRMNKLIEIDEKNMIATVEPYVTYMQVQAELWKKGMNLLIITAGPHCSILASVTSHQGGGGASCSMGYNGRNLLACEWVSPTGEIMQIGSLESGAGWISADGPGPSMKGILRGYFGYDGGFGIFTKAAIKLYHWPGPPEINVKGHMFDAELEVPENFHSYMFILPHWDALKEAFHRIGQTELAYFMNKLALPLTGWTLVPRTMAKLVKYPVIKEALAATKQCIPLIIAGYSPGDLAYKVKCLKQIAEELGGVLIGGHPESQLDKTQWMGTITAATYLMGFSGPNTFHVAMGADESIDAICQQGIEAEKIKTEYIKQGRATDDLGDGAWACIYDQSTWGHCEAVMAYEMGNEKHANSMQAFSDDCADVVYSKHLGGIGFAMFGGLKTIEKFNGATSHFFDWTKRIKKIWDPDNLANLTFR